MTDRAALARALFEWIETLDDRSLDDLRQAAKEGVAGGDIYDTPDNCETQLMITRGEIRQAREWARVLAEHETHWAQDELDAAKWRAHERAAGFDVPCARAEAAEARCAQLEQERNELRKSRLRILLDEARRRLAEYEAEHERLRAALQSIVNNSCCIPCREAGLVAKAALAPSQEPVT